MNHHLAAADIVPTTTTMVHDAADVITAPGAHAPITGWHALEGIAIGILRGMAPGTDVEVLVEQVVEEATDLAVADRVAWILTGRTGRQHVVLAASSGYLVATVSPELDWAAAMRMEPGQHAPQVVSVANVDGVLPVLRPVTG